MLRSSLSQAFLSIVLPCCILDAGAPRSTKEDASVLLWKEAELDSRCPADLAALPDKLKEEGFSVLECDTETLSQPGTLDPETHRTVLLPYPNLFPWHLGQAMSTYLSKGGFALSLFGEPFSEALCEVDGHWVPALRQGDIVREIEPGNFTNFSHAGAQDRLERKESPKAGELLLVTDSLTSHAYVGVPLEGLPASAELLVFQAKSIEDERENTPFLCVELQEMDGSRWKQVVALTPAWQSFSIHTANFVSYATEKRGEAADFFHSERSKGLWFGFTAGMVGKGSHAFAVKEIALRKAIVPSSIMRQGNLTLPGEDKACQYFGKDITDERERFPLYRTAPEQMPTLSANVGTDKELLHALRFSESGLLTKEPHLSFSAQGCSPVMKIAISVFSRGEDPIELRIQQRMTLEEETEENAESFLLESWDWNECVLYEKSISPKQLSRIRLDLKYRSERLLSQGGSRVHMDALRALEDLSDFLVEQARERDTFSDISFIDHRGARTLLGAYKILEKPAYRETAVRWALKMADKQREDGGYRMGYGITDKGEACYVADGGEIALGVACAVPFADEKAQHILMKSLDAYMNYRESFRCEGGGIGVGWCLNDYAQRPVVPLEKATRIYAPERNTYTIGCTLGAAYLHAELSGEEERMKQANEDALWLMERTPTLHGPFIESFLFAHRLTTDDALREDIEAYVERAFVKKVVGREDAWWMNSGGRHALDLQGLLYCAETLPGLDNEIRARCLAEAMEAAYAMFGSSSQQSLYLIQEKQVRSLEDWIYLCYGAVCLPDWVRTAQGGRN